MIEALLPRRQFWIAAALGAYAALFSIVPGATGVLAVAAPLLLAAIAWWTVLAAHRWVMAFLCAAVLLPPLPIALGNAGPHPSLLLAALGLLAGALRLGEWRIPRGSLHGSFLLFFFVLLGSVPLAALYSGAAIAAGTLARVLLFGISLYLFFYVAYGPGHTPSLSQVHLLYWAAVASALFACIDFYFQFPAPAGFGPQFVWLDTGVFRRAQGVFYEASTLGNFCAFFLVMVAVALLRPPAERPVSRPALLAGGAVFSAALVFSYSRASIVNVAVALTALWLLRRKGGRLPLPGARLFLLLLALAAGAASSYLAFPAFFQTYWDRLWRSVPYFFSFTEVVLSGRLASWRVLIDFLIQHPWHALLGIGYKTLPYSDFIGQPVVADNMYLSILVETGLAGLTVMLLFHGSILRAAYKAARHPDHRVSFFGAWIFCFWAGQMFQMLSGDLLTYWRVLPVYFWVLAIAVRRSREHPVS